MDGTFTRTWPDGTSRHFNAQGFQTAVTNRNGNSTTYTWSSASGTPLLSSITDPNTSVLLGYDQARRFTSLTFPNNTLTTWTYGTAGRLTDIDHSSGGIAFLEIGYEFDDVSRVTALVESAGRHDFGLDELGQITSASHPVPASNPNETFGYDASGNRTSSHLSAIATFDEACQIMADDPFDYQFDSNGNMIQKVNRTNNQTTTYVYDVRDRLIRVELPGGLQHVFAHDVLNRRIAEGDGTSLNQYFGYDGLDQLFESDATGTVTATWLFGPGLDNPFLMRRNGQDYAYHRDHVGSVRKITDGAGIVVNSYEYDSFGQRMLAQEGVVNPFGFTCRIYVPEIEMMDYRSRWMTPSTGRFNSPDIFGVSSLGNPYTYVENQPQQFVDPLGLWYWAYGPGVFGGYALGVGIFGDAGGGVGYGTTASGGMCSFNFKSKSAGLTVGIGAGTGLGHNFAFSLLGNTEDMNGDSANVIVSGSLIFQLDIGISIPINPEYSRLEALSKAALIIGAGEETGVHGWVGFSGGSSTVNGQTTFTEEGSYDPMDPSSPVTYTNQSPGPR